MQPVNADDFVTAPPGTYLVAADEDLARLVWLVSTEGWRPLLIDRHVAGRKPSLLQAFANGLGFPEWFGHNWDALVELLRRWADYQPLVVMIAEFGPPPDDGGVGNDELATVATLTDIFDDLIVEGHPLKLGVVPAQ